MNIEELNKLRLEVFEKKSHDYNSGIDPTASFSRSAKIAGVKPHVYIKQLLAQKLSRLESYVNLGVDNMLVKDEGLLDTVVDMTSYCAIHDALEMFNFATSFESWKIETRSEAYHKIIRAWKPETMTKEISNLKMNSILNKIEISKDIPNWRMDSLLNEIEIYLFNDDQLSSSLDEIPLILCEIYNRLTEAEK